jgi:hypothetical protein
MARPVVGSERGLSASGGPPTITPTIPRRTLPSHKTPIGSTPGGIVKFCGSKVLA